MTDARLYSISSRALIKPTNPEARLYSDQVQILFKKVPFYLTAAGSAAASATVDIGLSPLHFGSGSAQATTSATTDASVVFADDDPNRPGGSKVAVKRWSFFEEATGLRWTLPLNPNTMDAIPRTKTVDTTVSNFGNPRPRTFQAPTPASDWKFGGFNLTNSQYNTLVTWVAKPGVILVRDHLGRAFRVIFEELKFDPPAGRPARNVRMNYTVSCKFLERKR